MALKGFCLYDYANELLAYYKDLGTEWQGKTVEDLLDIASQFGIDLEKHYLDIGWKLGFSPNRYFDPDEYKLAWEVRHPSDSIDGIDPYRHYLDVGAAENINPSNAFDESDYINSVLNYFQQQSPKEWSQVTCESLKSAMVSFGITALTFHIDYNIDEELFPVFTVPPEEAVAADVIPDDRVIVYIDAGDFANAKVFDASGGSFRFVEKPDLASNVEITGFGEDDLIALSSMSCKDYFFTNDRSDVMVSINIDGQVSIVRLIGVLDGRDDIIIDGSYESFRSAVGFDAFVSV